MVGGCSFRGDFIRDRLVFGEVSLFYWDLLHIGIIPFRLFHNRLPFCHIRNIDIFQLTTLSEGSTYHILYDRRLDPDFRGRYLDNEPVPNVGTRKTLFSLLKGHRDALLES